MLFGGSNGITAFFPEHIRDNPYVPPVVLTSFKIFNRPVPVGATSILKKAIPYVESLTLSYRDSVFSFEFAALSYANSHKNRYRYKLENLESGWNEVGSKQRVATYTNLDPGHYVFRVQGSNSDGVWNEAGVSLPILITPPWWMTTWFRALFVGLVLALLWAAYQFRIRQVQHAFAMTLEARVGERTRIARELHDTLLQSFHGLLLQFQTVSYLLPERPAEAKEKLDGAIQRAAKAITEGRDAVQGLRTSTVERNDLAVAIRTLGDELATASAHQPSTFGVAVEGHTRDLHPIVRDEIYKIAAEALRNAFRHADAGRVEVEIRYDDEQFRLRVRDNGKGIDPTVLASQGLEGHYGLRGMPERAALIGGKLAVWSEAGAGTEVELCLAASIVYATSARRTWWSRLLAPKTPANGRETLTGSSPIRILTVDDHPLVREGIAGLLGVQPDMTVVAEAANGREAIQQFRAHRPDVMLMDIQMPEMNGLDALIAIRTEFPDAKVVVLTTYEGDVHILRALKAGARGYLLKNTFHTELLQTIRAVHAGKRSLSSEVSFQVAQHVSDETLTPAEVTVLRLIADGNANKQIADQLGVTEDTVKGRVKTILSKLDANDRTHAVIIGLKKGIIDRSGV